MAFNPVPFGREVKVYQDIAGVSQPINTFSYSYLGDPGTLTQAEANSVAEGVEGVYEANLAARLSTLWSITRITVQDLRTVTAPLLDGVFDPLAGGDGSDLLATQNAALVIWKTALRGRSFTGKSYVAGFGEAQSNGSPIVALIGQLNTWAAAMITFFASLGGGTGQQIVVSRFSGTDLVDGPRNQKLIRPKPRVGNAVITPITNGFVDQHWHTQRRRGQPR